MEALSTGLWRCRLLGRLVFLVSSIDLPVEQDSLPLHVVGKEPLTTERRVARLVLDNPGLQMAYGGWLATLHPTAWKEIEAMARATGTRLDFDILPAIESFGLDRVIEQVGVDRVIEQIGLQRVLEKADDREVIKLLGADRILAGLAGLTPAERRLLKKRLQ
jgi:hypothetical protein